MRDLPPRIALFIDAENIAADFASGIIARAKELGRLTIGRCFGHAEAQRSWAGAIEKYQLRPMLTTKIANLKNASDFELIIDAVAVSHRGLCDEVVIASGDTGFYSLVRHLRELGLPVHGVLKHNAAIEFQKAFDTIKLLEDSASEKPQTRPVEKIQEIDWVAFRKAALRILATKGQRSSLNAFRSSLQKSLGPDYPAGTLPSHINTHLKENIRYYPESSEVERIN